MMDYKQAGVDVEAGREFVDNIRNLVVSTHRPEVLGGLGGFSGLFCFTKWLQRTCFGFWY